MDVGIFKRYLTKVVNGRGIYWYGRNEGSRVALTFDDGPNEKYTPMVLDILKAASIHATFFLIGEKIQPNVHVVQRIIDEGHEIGNHTYTHRELSNLTWEDMKLDILKADELLKETFNITTNYLRLPKGNWNYLIFLIAIILKKKLVFWSIDPKDFRANSSEEVIFNIGRTGIKGGDIILLHDNQEHTVNALNHLIAHLNDNQLKAVTLSELIGN